MKFREIGSSIGDAILRQVGRLSSNVQESRPIPVDLLESDDAYLAVFDAAGATQDDVQVRFVDGTIRVRIDRFRDLREGFEMQFPGRGLSLDGGVELPNDAAVVPEAATGTLTESGALEIYVPKADEAEIDGADDGNDVAVTDDLPETGTEGDSETGPESPTDSGAATDPSADGDGTDDQAPVDRQS